MSSHQQVTKHAHLQYEKIRNAREFLNNAYQNSYRTVTLCMKKKVFEPNTQYMHAHMHTNTHTVAAKKAHNLLYLAHNCTYEGRGTYMYMYHTCFACQYPTQLENCDIHCHTPHYLQRKNDIQHKQCLRIQCLSTVAPSSFQPIYKKKKRTL